MLDAVSVDGGALRHVHEHEKKSAGTNENWQTKFTDDFEIVARAVLGANRRGFRIAHCKTDPVAHNHKAAPCVVYVQSKIFYALFPEQEPWSDLEILKLTQEVDKALKKARCSDSTRMCSRGVEPCTDVKLLTDLGKKRASYVLETWKRYVNMKLEEGQDPEVETLELDIQNQLKFFCKLEKQKMHCVRNYVEATV